MPTQVSRKRFTVSEYHKMAEAGILPERGVELMNGEIIEMSPIGSKHLSCVNTLNELLTEKLGRTVIVSIQNPVQLNDFSEPEPDIALLKRDQNRYADRIPTSADTLLIIEVADTSIHYDRTVKLPAYAKSSIPECWIVNLEAREIEVYWQPFGDTYRNREILCPGDLVVARRFDLSLDVSEILG